MSWFQDASRLTDEISATVSVPKITGRPEHRNNAPSVNPESYYRVRIAIPFIDNLLEEMSSRFGEDSRAGAESFSLVPSAVVKHDSRHNLAENAVVMTTGLTYNVLSSFWVIGMTILLETIHTHFTATGKSYPVCKICWWGYVPEHTSFAYYWLPPSCQFFRRWSFILWFATNQIISQKQDVWWAVVRTCPHTRTSWPWQWCWRNLYNLWNQTCTRGGCSKGASFTRVESK